MNKIRLNEKKREVRRYYIRPQGLFAANKKDIIKALIEISEKNENCSIYTLNNLGDDKDVTKLTSRDIIYYYDKGVLYDKNHVRIMDYDLFIKHEEKRKKFAGEPNMNSLEAQDEYDDRMTEIDLKKDTDESLEADSANLQEAASSYSTPEDWALEAEKDFNNGLIAPFKKWQKVLLDTKRNLGKDPAYYDYDKKRIDWYTAYINRFRELTNGQKTEKRAENKLNAQVDTGKEIAKDPKVNIPDMIDWLSDHVTRLYFSLPDISNNNIPTTVIRRLTKTYKELERQFPGITQDREHFEWENRGPETKSSYYGYWGLNGHVIFDTDYKDLPYFVKDLINQAKLRSESVGRNVSFDINDSARKFDNIYLVFAILDIFNRELDFYKTSHVSITDPGTADTHEFDQEFPDTNEALTEDSQEEHTCCICGETFTGYGNNPSPVREEGVCCDSCNQKFVIPTRFSMLQDWKDDSETEGE